ncbi:MAG TPA: hypothetical protein VM580_18880, partial [Labilithrix sp.]|nr:hypothetical protein [Labilithrix sp.]
MDVDRVLASTQTDLFWVPEDASVVRRPEILYLACPRDEPYLNAVLSLQASDHQLPALIDEVDAAHRDVGSRWMLSGSNRRATVENLLERAGYRPSHEHFAYSIRVDAYRSRPAPSVLVRPVTDRDQLRAWIEVGARA